MRLLVLLVAFALTLAACTDTEPVSDAPLGATPAPDAVVADTAAVDTTAADTTVAMGEMEGAMPTESMAEPTMAAAEVVAEGTFSGHRNHDVAGRAFLYRLGDGSHAVRLEGLDSDNGPDLRVWLVTDLADKTNGPIDLGRLKSTRGDQNYTVPADADVTNAAGVSIWCRAFSVEFGTAPL
ncbi:MAG: DM13 domain-containing protein [Bacteroidota bacterium]